MNDSTICLKPISALLTDEQGRPTNYWIPAYQRGYRWSPLQVTQLLDDVWEFVQGSEGGNRHQFYCLQPLVIKALPDGGFEVVDGQQRLTTILILLTYLKEMVTMLGKIRFQLTFATRGEPNQPFLKDIDLTRAEENVDLFHICQAYRAVEGWFQNRDGMHKLKLLQHLLNDDEAGRNVKVIWFQLADSDNPVDAFTRLNVGKIPLTNDELIRALFLRRTRADESEAQALQLKIAYEWDQIEKALQSDAFWYFLSNQGGKAQNRIGFLFDLIARAEGLPPGAEHDDYGIFYAFSQKLKAAEASPEQEWRKIKQTFMLLEEWFEDRILYHVAGFLVSEGMHIGEISELSRHCTKTEFERKLRGEIYARVIGGQLPEEMNEEAIRTPVTDKLEELEYGLHRAKIKSLLLLFNLATLLQNKQSNLRFQFNSFKSELWNIEHVRSVTSDKSACGGSHLYTLAGCFLRPTLRRASANWGNNDGDDEGSAAVEIGIAFGQRVDRGEVVFAEQISQPTETPAQNHHVGGEEGEREFLRRRVLVFAGVRVGFQSVINQLAGVKTMPAVFIQMELDAGAILAGAGIAFVFGEGH
jgi:hypothetical protein